MNSDDRSVIFTADHAFEIASGSATGAQHVLDGRPNQDAHCILTTPTHTIVALADGCSEGEHSEVGAHLGARYAVRGIEQGIEFFLSTSAPLTSTTSVDLLSDEDDSMDIENAGNTQHVIDGANGVLDAVGSSKDDGILVCVQTLNRGVIYPYMSLAQAARISRANYTPDGYTPLYDMSAEVVGLSVVKAQDFAGQGVPCRNVTLIVTDGADVGSKHIRRPEGVKPLIHAALKTEQHIICAMGIDDGSTDFRAVFTKMGLRDNWILTPKSNGHEIRAAFTMFSRSAARASQAATGGAFSKVAAGGFASP